MRQVVDFPLWLGHVGDARDPARLHAAGIAAVVDLADAEPLILHPRSFLTLRFPLLDGADNPPWLLRLAVRSTTSLILARVPTLIHCAAGMSRTPALAAVTLSLVASIPPTTALHRLTQFSPIDLSPALWADFQAALIDLPEFKPALLPKNPPPS